MHRRSTCSSDSSFCSLCRWKPQSPVARHGAASTSPNWAPEFILPSSFPPLLPSCLIILSCLTASIPSFDPSLSFHPSIPLIHPSINPSMILSLYYHRIHLSIPCCLPPCLPPCLPASLPPCPPAPLPPSPPPCLHPSISPFIDPSVHLSIRLSVRQFTHPAILSFMHPFLNSLYCTAISPSIHPYIHAPRQSA